MSETPFTHREIEALSQSMRDLSGTIERLRAEMSSTYVRKDVLEPQIKEIREDVARHSGYWDWLVRLVIGVVIVALLSLVIVQGGAL